MVLSVKMPANSQDIWRTGSHRSEPTDARRLIGPTRYHTPRKPIVKGHRDHAQIPKRVPHFDSSKLDPIE